MPKPKIQRSLTWSVIRDGWVHGKVVSGKNKAGKVRHVASDATGDRIGTFDTFKEAETAVLNAAGIAQ